jgi:hypothetical protein
MREPCRWCMRDDGALHLDGAIRNTNGQDVIRCTRCSRLCYNAPKAETGKPQKTVKDRPRNEGQRERILARDGARCQLCGRDPKMHQVVLHIAHCVSVDEGRKVGLSDEILFADYNLFAACEECNLAMKNVSVEPKFMWGLLITRFRRGRQ